MKRNNCYMCDKCNILARKVIEQEEEIKALNERLELRAKMWYGPSSIDGGLTPIEGTTGIITKDIPF